MSKIYGSTEYIAKPEVGDLKLEVISQWDFKTKAVCYEKTSGTMSSGMVIPFSLMRCTDVFSPTHTKWEYVENPTQDMLQTLTDDGYQVASL